MLSARFCVYCTVRSLVVLSCKLTTPAAGQKWHSPVNHQELLSHNILRAGFVGRCRCKSATLLTLRNRHQGFIPPRPPPAKPLGTVNTEYPESNLSCSQDLCCHSYDSLALYTNMWLALFARQTRVCFDLTRSAATAAAIVPAGVLTNILFPPLARAPYHPHYLLYPWRVHKYRFVQTPQNPSKQCRRPARHHHHIEPLIVQA